MDYIHELRPLIGHRKIILNAATTIIERDGKILLQRRTDNGKWGLIGGLLEMNETYQEAALREVKEESGLEVKLDAFLGIYHNHDMVWANGDAAHRLRASSPPAARRAGLLAPYPADHGHHCFSL